MGRFSTDQLFRVFIGDFPSYFARLLNPKCHEEEEDRKLRLHVGFVMSGESGVIALRLILAANAGLRPSTVNLSRRFEEGMSTYQYRREQY